MLQLAFRNVLALHSLSFSLLCCWWDPDLIPAGLVRAVEGGYFWIFPQLDSLFFAPVRLGVVSKRISLSCFCLVVSLLFVFQIDIRPRVCSRRNPSGFQIETVMVAVVVMVQLARSSWRLVLLLDRKLRPSFANNVPPLFRFGSSHFRLVRCVCVCFCVRTYKTSGAPHCGEDSSCCLVLSGPG